MAAPSWPRVKRKGSLERQRLEGVHLFTVENVLSKAESESFIAAAESMGFKHQGSLGPSYGEAFRDNDRISIHSTALAKQLWDCGISALFDDIQVEGRRAIGLNPNIRFYRYSRGQRFGQHIDESVGVDRARTEYTLLVYLNTASRPSKKKTCSATTELVGGETVFYSGKRVVAEVAPVAGMGLFHLHGDECMLHEARAVTIGVKYVLRSDVVFEA